ncbi:acetolactate synthase, small subunit [Desulfurobacterium pacificum]|uniref:Acetolactate synthase small subunit n=1 Tax=Desulfurobacterium pacificum TaxID=240166 RepID=A0ABY1NS38_9BACT|nr:acetolactate synthase small subunit [Desulfurobacterium pacificum]SMP16789.1 acetolactate synthase, small subunit [Desulfurobacterium pacificum]
MERPQHRKHVISVLVENQPGALARIIELFSSRGYNIESLNVGHTEDPSISRITMVAKGDEHTIEQIVKQLRRIIDVFKVRDLTDKKKLDRELLVVRINVDSNEKKEEAKRLVEIFGAQIVDISHDTYTIELTGDEAQVDAFLELIKPLGIREMARTGRVAMVRALQGDTFSDKREF